MTRRHVIAVAVAFGAMLVALLPPLWVSATGETVYPSLNQLSSQRRSTPDIILQASREKDNWTGLFRTNLCRSTVLMSTMID